MELLAHSNKRRAAIYCLFLLNVGPVWAQTDVGIRLKTTVPVLTASPNVCELQADQRACTMRVALIWEVPRAGNFCLYRQHNQHRLACWNGKWSGVYQLDFQSGNTENFLLKRQGSDKTLVQTPIKVIGAIKQKVRARRRSGIWRMF